MSTREYAFTGYGVLLDDIVDEDLLCELSETGEVEVQFSFTGEVFPLRDDGCEDWGEVEYKNDEPLYFISLPKYPQFFKAVYSDMEALVSDMHMAYSQVRGLPKLSKDEVRKRLRSFQGTYYG